MHGWEIEKILKNEKISDQNVLFFRSEMGKLLLK